MIMHTYIPTYKISYLFNPLNIYKGFNHIKSFDTLLDQNLELLSVDYSIIILIKRDNHFFDIYISHLSLDSHFWEHCPKHLLNFTLVESIWIIGIVFLEDCFDGFINQLFPWAHE